MKLYSKKTGLNHIEKRIIEKLTAAIEERRRLNPNFAKDLTVANDIDELKALYAKYTSEAEDVPSVKQIIEKEGIASKHNKMKVLYKTNEELNNNKKVKMARSKKEDKKSEVESNENGNIEAAETADSKNEMETPKVETPEYTIEELEQNIENAALNYSKGNKVEENIGDSHTNKTDPDYIPESVPNPMDEEVIQNESEANIAGKKASGNGSNNVPPKDFAEPTINGVSSGMDEEKDKKQTPPKKPLTPDFDSMSPTDRKKQVELFADAILTNYAELLPIIPKLIAKYDMDKMQLLDDDGVIRLSMIVQRDENGDMTIRQHIKEFNDKVDATFVVTDEMKAELREPLIMVLMEKGIAPTPMVSLLLTVGKHALMFTIAAVQMRGERNAAIKAFTKFRKNEIEVEKDKHKGKQFGGDEGSEGSAPVSPPNKPNPPSRPVVKKQKEASSINIEEVLSEEIPNVTIRKGGSKEADNEGITITEDDLNE